jgi:hypothetical protein
MASVLAKQSRQRACAVYVMVISLAEPERLKHVGYGLFEQAIRKTGKVNGGAALQCPACDADASDGSLSGRPDRQTEACDTHASELSAELRVIDRRR